MVDENGDVVVEASGDGTGTVFAGADWVMSANLAFGRLFGAATRLSGSAGGETLVANTLASILDGLGGDDSLWGQSGADSFVFGAPGLGYDQLFDFNRVAGDVLDFRGSGASFDTLSIGEIGIDSFIVFGSAPIDVYGVTGLAAGDFLFG